ncbi:MAG: diguanylate cyclase [Chloroflexi bacterium]|nr:diguanylate cyclase [Chloroflexota bacterium]
MTAISENTQPAAIGGLAAIAVPERPVARLAWLGMTPDRVVDLARRDQQLILAIFLAVPVVLIELTVGQPPAPLMLWLSAAFVAFQGLLTVSPVRAWSTARLSLSLGFVIVASLHGAGQVTGPVAALYVPVVAMAAAIGTRGALLVALAGFVSTVAPFMGTGFSAPAGQATLALGAAEIVLAVGSRRIVASLEAALEQARVAHGRERLRSQRLSTVEAVGRLLAREGPSSVALATVMDILVDTFGFRYPSVYFRHGTVLRLGAQRNYEHPILEFDSGLGVIGRVARTHEPAFVTDVTVDEDYEAADPAVNSEISVPLLDGDELLGVLNVESDLDRRLDAEDFATMQIVGDRLAAALALGRERTQLAERGELLARLTNFSAGLNALRDPLTTHERAASGAAEVIDATMAALVLREPESGDFRIAAVKGGDEDIVGVRVLPGEGASGRAIEQRQVVVDDHLDRAHFPRAAGTARVPDVVAAMAIPLVRDDQVFGAITWLRGDLGRPFSPAEQEVAALLGVQVSLALVNHALLFEAQEAALTDPLTGLNNRRFFDASLEQLVAMRIRQPEQDRHALSAIMFDLDHFGLVNKRHGHQVGDRVLRAFAEVLRARVRSSDLVARYGGEEFVVILPGATRGQAALLAEHVRESFAAWRITLPSGEIIGCTVSAGCAALAAGQDSGMVLIDLADVALSMAKAAGRNQVVTT